MSGERNFPPAFDMIPAFAGYPLDRADQLRSDEDQLSGYLNWKARLLRLEGLNPPIDTDARLQWASLAEAASDSGLIFLGLEEERAHFVELPAQTGTESPFFNPALWRGLSLLPAGDLAIYAAARSLLIWHGHNGFCANCGTPTTLAKAGWARKCGNCGTEHFPRVDPVAIMLVEHDGDLLLGRQPRFPPGAFSALAGFVELGESLEGAVKREVHEEAGIAVDQVRYVISQPWPFPSSLMIGCHAMAKGRDIHLDENELEEARWFTRDEVAAAMAGDENASFIAPPEYAVARNLLEYWLKL